jgi:hypothetical protein
VTFARKPCRWKEARKFFAGWGTEPQSGGIKPQRTRRKTKISN